MDANQFREAAHSAIEESNLIHQTLSATAIDAHFQ
jgi:hypothetical protein